jgi:AraC-like DNA-binding protein
MLHPANALAPLVSYFHEDAFEISLVTQGTMSFYCDEKEYDVPGGNVFISFPNEVHSTNEVPLSPLRMFWIQVEISDPDHFFFLDHESAIQLIRSLHTLKTHTVHTDNGEIRKVMEKAFRCCLQGQDRLLISSYLCIFFKLLTAFAQCPAYKDFPDIQNVVAYIDDHISEDLTLEFLASLSSLSTSQFKQKFSRVVGTSPRQYINNRKIKYAKKLLLSTRSVTDTAMELGFNNSSYFSTVFRKYAACSPSEYLKQHR